jgi:hypothetical protein
VDEAQVIDAIRRFHQQALDAKSAVEGGHVAWRAATWSLAQWVQRGKKEVCGGSTKKFHKWLKDNRLDFLNPNDRSALLGLAANPTIAQPIIEKTTRTSWQRLWREEVQPEVERLCSPTKSGTKNGRPKRSTPVPPASPPGPSDEDLDGLFEGDNPRPPSPLDEPLQKDLVKILRQSLTWASQHRERNYLISTARWCRDQLESLLEGHEETDVPLEEYEGEAASSPAMGRGTAADGAPDVPF